MSKYLKVVDTDRSTYGYKEAYNYTDSYGRISSSVRFVPGRLVWKWVRIEEKEEGTMRVTVTDKWGYIDTELGTPVGPFESKQAALSAAGKRGYDMVTVGRVAEHVPMDFMWVDMDEILECFPEDKWAIRDRGAAEKDLKELMGYWARRWMADLNWYLLETEEMETIHE